MKKIVGIIIFIMIIVLGVVVSYIAINIGNDSKLSVNTVTIIQNQFNSDEAEIINITNEKHIKEIEKIYNKLTKLDANYYDLALGGTTDIVLNNEITIIVQLSNPDLCTYTGLEGSEFVETPRELIEWINKVLDK